MLFLCLLLLPAATAFSEETEGSANGDVDDEDGIEEETVIAETAGIDLIADKTTGAEGNPDQITMIVIIVAVAALTLSVSAIVTIMLVRRHMQKREQGIYSVPTEQDQKGV